MTAMTQMTGQTVYSEKCVTSVITVTNRKYEKEKKAMANYEIVKKIAVLGGKPDGVTKEINIVKWGVYDPMIDIRRWPVSYTHLDVYKRQAGDKGRLRACQT